MIRDVCACDGALPLFGRMCVCVCARVMVH